MRVLFVASEGLPFSKTGGLADVIEALPKALRSLGHEIAVLLPRYRGTTVQNVVLPSVSVPMGSSVRFPAIEDGARPSGVQYFFVDDSEYFDRDQLYGVGGKDYPDNGERYAEFCRAAVELAKQVWRPDLIHCHDWQTALVPVLLHSIYRNDPFLRNVPVVFTVHNMGYQGVFPKELMGRIGLPDSLFSVDGMEFYGKVNYLKGGLAFADYLTTVSRTYAREIQTPEYGHGLDGVARRRSDRLTGILNGADYSVWNPEVDAVIASRYTAKDLSGKALCKKDLVKEFGLPAEAMERPLIGIVSRFDIQKGIDLLAQAGDALLREELSMVVLGSGDAKYEKAFADLAHRHPGRLQVKMAYNNVLAHKIEAGSDMFLMPSRYEPCGLNQIYSLRYGTVPIVRATGGLDDTIEQFDPITGRGTGFKFREYTGEALLSVVRQALTAYRDKAAWRKVASNGMGKDFSWAVSAQEYVRLYEGARKARIPRGTASSN